MTSFLMSNFVSVPEHPLKPHLNVHLVCMTDAALHMLCIACVLICSGMLAQLKGSGMLKAPQPVKCLQSNMAAGQSVDHG